MNTETLNARTSKRLVTLHRGRTTPGALLTLFFLLAPGAAFAHHGRDFLLVQTAELPHKGEIYLVARQDYLDEGEEEEIELEPAVIFGLTGRLAFEVHSHVAREGDESFEYESTSPALHLRLSPLRSAWGLGLSAEYEIASGDEEDHAEARLVLSRFVGGARVAFNLIAEEEQSSGAEVEWGYAVGFRARLGERSGWGLEARGGFESDAEAEALFGLYFEPSNRVTMQLGAGTALGDEGPDLSIRTALVFRLR